MSKFLKAAITALVALSMWACVDNANSNKPANTTVNSNANATAAKPAPVLDTLMAQEKSANEAYTKGDGQFFQNLLSDKFMASSEDAARTTGTSPVSSICLITCVLSITKICLL